MVIGQADVKADAVIELAVETCGDMQKLIAYITRRAVLAALGKSVQAAMGEGAIGNRREPLSKGISRIASETRAIREIGNKGIILRSIDLISRTTMNSRTTNYWLGWRSVLIGSIYHRISCSKIEIHVVTHLCVDLTIETIDVIV